MPPRKKWRRPGRSSRLPEVVQEVELENGIRYIRSSFMYLSIRDSQRNRDFVNEFGGPKSVSPSISFPFHSPADVRNSRAVCKGMWSGFHVRFVSGNHGPHPTLSLSPSFPIRQITDPRASRAGWRVSFRETVLPEIAIATIRDGATLRLYPDQRQDPNRLSNSRSCCLCSACRWAHVWGPRRAVPLPPTACPASSSLMDLLCGSPFFVDFMVSNLPWVKVVTDPGVGNCPESLPNVTRNRNHVKRNLPFSHAGHSPSVRRLIEPSPIFEHDSGTRPSRCVEAGARACNGTEDSFTA